MPKEEKPEKFHIHFETSADRIAEIELVKKEKDLETTKEAIEYFIDRHEDAKRIDILKIAIEYWMDEAHKSWKPLQDFINQKDTLDIRVSDMTNTLLERDAQIAILETDNMYLRAKIASLERERDLYERTTHEGEKVAKF
jgi:hypothetical protein